MTARTLVVVPVTANSDEERESNVIPFPKPNHIIWDYSDIDYIHFLCIAQKEMEEF